MTTPYDSACWKNSSGETTLLKPFDCTPARPPSSLNIFIVLPINSGEDNSSVPTVSDSRKKAGVVKL